MKRMVKKFMTSAFSVSPGVEWKMRWYCCIIYVVDFLKGYQSTCYTVNSSQVSTKAGVVLSQMPPN